MALRLIRCPHCHQRFNAPGVPAGARIQCTICARQVRVPAPTMRHKPSRRRWLPEKPGLQVMLACGLGLALSLGAYLLLRPERPEPVEEQIVDAGRGDEERTPRDERRDRNYDERQRPGVWFEERSVIQQLLFDEFGAKNIAVKSAYPFLIAVEGGPRFVQSDLIDDYADRLSMLHKVFQKEFADPLKLKVVDRVLPVVILSSRESYDEYCRKRFGKKAPSQITGMYEYSRRRTVMYHDAWAPYEVIFHEGAHQLVHHYTDKKRAGVHAYWFQEGMGTYFEGFTRRDGEIVLDPKANRNRLPAVRTAIEEGKDIPLESLLRMSVEGFWAWFDKSQDDANRAELAQLYYAESWALVHFMLHAEKGRFRRAFLRYFGRELKGQGTLRDFEKAVRDATGLDLPDVQKKFVDYILDLE